MKVQFDEVEDSEFDLENVNPFLKAALESFLPMLSKHADKYEAFLFWRDKTEEGSPWRRLDLSVLFKKEGGQNAKE